MSNIAYYKNQNREQRTTIEELEETIRLLKKQNLETRESYYSIFVRLSKIAHSDNMYKVIEMSDIIDKTLEQMYEDLKMDLYIENDEEGKIIELITDRKIK